MSVTFLFSSLILRLEDCFLIKWQSFFTMRKIQCAIRRFVNTWCDDLQKAAPPSSTLDFGRKEGTLQHALHTKRKHALHAASHADNFKPF